MKVCRNAFCQQNDFQDLNKFYTMPNSIDGLEPICKKCHNFKKVLRRKKYNIFDNLNLEEKQKYLKELDNLERSEWLILLRDQKTSISDCCILFQCNENEIHDCLRIIDILTQRRKVLNYNLENRYIYVSRLYAENNYSIEECCQILQIENNVISSYFQDLNIFQKNNLQYCLRCSSFKDKSNFPPDKRGINGLKSWCRSCFMEQYRKTYEDRKPVIKEYQRINYDYLRERSQEWRQNNPEKTTKYWIEYQCCKNQASVAWANQDLIKEIYLESQRLTEETGIVHQVDHIIPLRGKNVCGLHIETNLQIITASENHVKRNKFNPIIESFSVDDEKI